GASGHRGRSFHASLGLPGCEQGGDTMSKAPKILAACGALAAASALTVATAAADVPETFSTLPPELQALYQGVEDTLQPSAYDDFKMPEKPWKWCHSESYQGNPWRVSTTNELKRLVDLYKEKGWVSSFEMSDSNGDVSRQIS